MRPSVFQCENSATLYWLSDCCDYAEKLKRISYSLMGLRKMSVGIKVLNEPTM